MFTFVQTINGNLKEEWADGSVDINYTDFVIDSETDAAETYLKYSIDGQMDVDFTPDAICGFEGAMTIATTTPINTNLSTGLTDAGVMEISPDTTIEFNADGTVTVTVTGQTPATYDSLDDIELDTCNIPDTDDSSMQ